MMARRVPTLEELSDELAAVERKLIALAEGSDFDPGMDFALKTEIGGIRSESARKKSKRRERWDREGADTALLLRRKMELEIQIGARQSHKEHREKVAATIEAVIRAKLLPGDAVHAGDYQGIATVMRVNKSTVSFRLPSGFTDRLPFVAIRPLEWERMCAEWERESGQ